MDRLRNCPRLARVIERIKDSSEGSRHRTFKYLHRKLNDSIRDSREEDNSAAVQRNLQANKVGGAPAITDGDKSETDETEQEIPVESSVAVAKANQKAKPNRDTRTDAEKAVALRRYYKRGTCLAGDACKYKHGENAKTVPGGAALLLVPGMAATASCKDQAFSIGESFLSNTFNKPCFCARNNRVNANSVRENVQVFPMDDVFAPSVTNNIPPTSINQPVPSVAEENSPFNATTGSDQTRPPKGETSNRHM